MVRGFLRPVSQSWECLGSVGSRWSRPFFPGASVCVRPSTSALKFLFRRRRWWSPLALILLFLRGVQGQWGPLGPQGVFDVFFLGIYSFFIEKFRA
jgi:hypothetical protein